MSGHGISGEDVWLLPLAGQYLNRRRGGHWMAACLEPKIGILPKAQQEIWPVLAPAPGLSFVLYGGTAVALFFAQLVLIELDLFSASPLAKKAILAYLPIVVARTAVRKASE